MSAGLRVRRRSAGASQVTCERVAERRVATAAPHEGAAGRSTAEPASRPGWASASGRAR